MKKILFICMAIAGLGLLIAGLAIPAFAHGADDTTKPDDGWSAMYEACQDGDWEAMEELHEEGFEHMYDHDEDYHMHEDSNATSSGYWGGMSDHMGGGWMMGR